MRDFTIQVYEELLVNLKKIGYSSCTVAQYLSDGPKTSHTVILRHDIDRRVMQAAMFSGIEKKQGFQATYYFRYPYTFDPNIIGDIAKDGHEIGYHYEVMSKCSGDPVAAKILFQKELEVFRKIYPVSTVCMHGAPLSKIDNRDFWKYVRFEDFGLLGEAYLSMGNTCYFSDTGRTWDQKHKIRDRLQTEYTHPDSGIHSTHGLLNFIKEKKPPVLYILIHPERWAKTPYEWFLLWVLDAIVNMGKRFLTIFRG